MKLKIKRILSVLLVFCMMIGVMPMQAFAAGEYTFDSATGEMVILSADGITAWEGTVAPADVKSITVKNTVSEIKGKVFQDLTNLENLVFEGDITIESENIGGTSYVPFAGTTKLATISFGGKTQIKSGVFSYSAEKPNTALKELTFPAGSTFGSAVFNYCNALEEITFNGDADISSGGSFSNLPELKTLDFKGESVIGSGALAGTTKLATISFGGKTQIKSGVFSYSAEKPNTALKELTFPAGSTFGSSVFNYCNALEEITFNGDADISSGGSFSNLPELKTLDFKGESVIGSGALAGTTKLATISFGGKTQIKSGVFSYSAEKPNTALKELTFPAGSTFGSSVFNYCNALEEITFNGDADISSGGSFSNLPELKTLDFKGESVIGTGALAGATKLATISFGGKTQIKSGVFSYSAEKPNTALKELTFPAGSTFGSSVFNYCNALEEITFNGDADISSGGSFSNLPELKTLDFKGKSVIGTGALAGATKLATISFGGKTQIKSGAFSYSAEKPNTALKELTFPAGSTFGSSVFNYCNALEEITFNGDADISSGGSFSNLPELKTLDFKGESVIGTGALAGATKLASVSFGDSTELGSSAFYNAGKSVADGMDPIVIPEGSTIGISAFSGANLTSIEFEDVTPPVFGYYAFSECPEGAIIYVPQDSLDAYIKALNEDNDGIANPVPLEIRAKGTEPEVPVKTTSVTVTKVWDDNDSENRPDSVMVVLKADGEDYGEPVTLNEENNWTCTWTELPEGNANAASAIVYTVDELEVPEGYEKSIEEVAVTTGIGYEITNTLSEVEPETPATTSVTVVKEWNVPEGTVIPESVRVNLYADGEQILSNVLSERNDWTWTVEELPVATDDGTPIVYTVDEVEVPEGYEKTIGEALETDTGIEIAITNTLKETEPEDPEKPVYGIVVNNGKSYTGAGVEITAAEEGAKITIKANEAPEGKEFDKWVVNNGTITLADATKAETTFDMPAERVQVTATYKDKVVTPPADDDNNDDTDKPSDTNKPTTDTELPKTGDTSNIFMWFAVLFVSGFALVGFTLFGRKRRA